MGSTRALLLTGAVALGVANAAHAADLPAPPPVYYPAPEPVAFGGWYLRGDVGAGIAMQNDIHSSFSEDVVVENNRFIHHTIDDNATIGGGVGYQFNNWFRFDVTGEYRTPQKYTSIQSYTAQDGSGGTAYDYYKGKIQSSVFLANASADLGTWYGVTPYVTGGVGAAYTVVSGLTDLGLGGINGYGYGGYGTAPSHDSWTLAWTAGVGIEYALTQNLKLDIGYRYLDMGDVRSAAIACNVQPSACERQKYHLASNDIRVGLRWLIGDYAPPPPPPPPEQPIIRKY